MEQVRHTVSGCLRDLRVVNEGFKLNQSNISFKFAIEHSPLVSFLQEQRFANNCSEAFESTITITGNPQDAEATTVKEYLSRTWPATGHKFCKLLCKIPWNRLENKSTIIIKQGELSLVEPNATILTRTETVAKLTAHTTVHLILVYEVILLTVRSDQLSTVMELAQQLSWLAAALQPSPLEKGLVVCTPHITADYPERVWSGDRPKCEFKIHFTTMGHDSKVKFSGDCWHEMFSCPIAVGGFPIRRKAEPSIGLELPLDMMAEFAGSNRIVEFDKSYLSRATRPC